MVEVEGEQRKKKKVTSRPLCVEGAGRDPDRTHRVRPPPTSILLGSEGASSLRATLPLGGDHHQDLGHNPRVEVD